MRIDRRTRFLVLSMSPYRYATRTRKAAVAYRDRGPVTFLALQGVGRTGKRDVSGTRTRDGVIVHQVPLRSLSTAPTTSSRLSNLVKYLPAFGRLLREVWRRDADVVHVTGVPLLVLGLLHQARHGSRLVLDVNERPASVSATGSLFALFRRVEPLLLRIGAGRADVTLVVTPGHSAMLRSDHGFGDVLVVRNAPLASWRSEYAPPPAREAGALRVVTVGTLFEGRGLEQLIHAVRIARDRDVCIDLDIHGAGRADYTASLIELASRLRIDDQVRFRGHLDSALVSEAYLAGHLGVALYEPTDAGNDSLSNKILECVSTGRPVLAGDLPENRSFVMDNTVGWLTPVTADGIAESLVACAAADDIDDLARRCRELGDHKLTWEAEFSAVLHALNRLHDPAQCGRRSRIASARADLAALGALAPVRAFYELGKRSGAHGLVLRAATRSVRPAVLQVEPGFRPHGRVSAAAAGRCLADAGLIIEQGHRAFGQRVPITAPDDWNVVGDSGARWPSPFWWRIDIRTEQRLGDVKWAWELGRHRDIVVLARAAFLRPAEHWAGELAQRLRWWFRATPTEHGVHWYSNLEIALRAVAWMQVYALCADVLPRDVRDAMALDVARARRHLLVDFPYTVSSMRNNHLLGDALGLLVIERFTGRGSASRLSVIAERAFAAQLGRHMRPDGSMIEDSVSYHRFVLEMLAVKHLLGDRSPATVTALGGAARHLRRMGVLDGPVPQWGDWDEGRVLASSGDALDLAGSTALGLVITEPSADARWWSEFDEVAWYAPPVGDAGVMTPAEQLPVAAAVVSGGIARATVGGWDVWLKGCTGPSHQHADLTHVSARLGDRWVLVDPGTGTYNGRRDVRNAFRTSGAHNGLRTRGEEMFVPHRSFRWLTSATVQCGVPVRAGGVVVVWAVHDAYSRPEGAGRIARAVVVNAVGLTVVDWREDGQNALLTVALAPGSETVDNDIRLACGTVLAVRGLAGGSAVEGQEQPFAGWHSSTYGCWEPATWLERSVGGTAATVWGVALPGSTGHDAVVHGCRVTVAGIELGMEFRPGSASMVVRAEGRTRIHTARTSAA